MANHTAQSQHPARPAPKADRAEPARAVSAVPAPRGLPVAATVLGVSASAVYVLAATLGPVVTRAGLDGWVWRPAVELGLAEPGAAAAGIVTHSGVVGAALATGAATAALLASGLLAVPAVAIRRTGLAVLTVWSASWLFMIFAALLSGDSEPLAAAAAVIGLLHLLCLSATVADLWPARRSSVAGDPAGREARSAPAAGVDVGVRPAGPVRQPAPGRKAGVAPRADRIAASNAPTSDGPRAGSTRSGAPARSADRPLGPGASGQERALSRTDSPDAEPASPRTQPARSNRGPADGGAELLFPGHGGRPNDAAQPGRPSGSGATHGIDAGRAMRRDRRVGPLATAHPGPLTRAAQAVADRR